MAPLSRKITRLQVLQATQVKSSFTTSEKLKIIIKPDQKVEQKCYKSLCRRRCGLLVRGLNSGSNGLDSKPDRDQNT